MNRASDVIKENVSQDQVKLFKTYIDKFFNQSENNKIIIITNNDEEKSFTILFSYIKSYNLEITSETLKQGVNNIFTTFCKYIEISYEDEKDALEFGILKPTKIRQERIIFYDNQETHYLPLDGSEEMLIGDVKRVFDQVGEPFPSDILV